MVVSELNAPIPVLLAGFGPDTGTTVPLTEICPPVVLVGMVVA